MDYQTAFLQEFTKGYIACAIWSAPEDEEGNTLVDYDSSNLSPETLKSMEEDCKDFVQAQWKDLQAYAEEIGGGWGHGASWAGHDFSLTRNGHGAGFWDRGLGELGQRLADAARVYGTSCLYLGDDGKLYEHN